MDGDFSLVNGGPAYWLLRRVGLTSLFSQAAVLALVAWLPLAVLSTAYRQFSFFLDIRTYARFLIAITIFILAEEIVARRTTPVAAHFATSGIVEEADLQDVRDEAHRLLARRDSFSAELVLLIAAYCASLLAHPLLTDRAVVPWRTAGPSLAGWWYTLVSVPIYDFLLLRWLWRIIIWFGFLHRLSRLHLRLMPTHPDQAAGLSVLEIGQMGFWPIALAGGIVVTAAIADSILFRGARLQAYFMMIWFYVVLMPLVLIGPLVMFSPNMIRTKIRGILDYDSLGNSYAEQFHNKWVKDSTARADVLGASDIQSLADLRNSFAVVQQMRATPFGPKSVAALALAAFLPFLPLALTEFSFAQIAKRLFKILL